MEVPATFRIVLLGENGNGKSSLANTIFGETMFKVKTFNDVKSFATEAKTKLVYGRNFTLVDTPGLFDSGRSLGAVNPELLRCIIECAPGPHIFLIILKVEKYTEQEEDVITKIRQYFSDDALKYAAVVFTHGDQLPEGMKIEQYAAQSESLWELVQKCGGRCHVFDNRYWKNNKEEEYRSNTFQLAELLNTIDKIIMANRGGHYSNTVLKNIEREIQEEVKLLKLSSENMSEDEIRQQVKRIVLQKQSQNNFQFWSQRIVRCVHPVGFAPPWKPWKKVSVGVGLLAVLIFFRLYWKSNAVQVPLHTIESVGEAGENALQQAAEHAIPNTFEAICNHLNALFEKIYNPFSPFE